LLKEVKVKALVLDKNHNTPVVILGTDDNPMVLPIWIGSCEAMALSLALENADFPRPLTHDLLVNTIEALDAQVFKVVIDSLRDNTYYAKLVIKDLAYSDLEDDPGAMIEIDCRPSDAIVIATKKNIPIYTSDEIMLEGGIKLSENPQKEDEEEFNKFVENMHIEDFRNYFRDAENENKNKDEKKDEENGGEEDS